jgi:hypothetical protein
VAVPAAPSSTCEQLRLEVDEVVCATTPSPFFAVGQAYWDFTQTTEEEVRDLLRAAAQAPAGAAGNGGPPSDVAVIRMSAALIENGVAGPSGARATGCPRYGSARSALRHAIRGGRS